MPDAETTATDPLADFAWHPEPELIRVTDPARSRAALEALGEATWREALDYLYDHAMTRSMGEPAGLRRAAPRLLRRVARAGAGAARPLAFCKCPA